MSSVHMYKSTPFHNILMQCSVGFFVLGVNEALSMWYCVYNIHTETVIIFCGLFISNLSKILKFAATHREMTTKSKYHLIIKNVC